MRRKNPRYERNGRGGEILRSSCVRVDGAEIQELAAGLGISGEELEQTNEQEQVEALRGKEECEKELRALGAILAWKKETDRVQKEELTREKEEYEGLVEKNGEEEQQLHQEIRELKEQETELKSGIVGLNRLVEEASTKKESRQSQPPADNGYESTGSVITVINTKKRPYAEVAKRKGKERKLKERVQRQGCHDRHQHHPQLHEHKRS